MLSNYVLEIPEVPSKGYVLLHDTLTGKGIAVHKSVYIALKRGDEDKLLQLPDAERRLLLSTFMVRDMAADKSRLLKRLDEMRSSSKTLAISLLLTTECNFACVYCHEYGVFQSTRTASHVEAAAIMDWIVAYAEALGVDRILCYFYGGEPLINLDLLVFAGSRLKQRALESGIRVEFDMSTNGSLLGKETAEVLLSMGLKTLQVSVDGPSEYHDSRRPLRGGGGSFELIMSNMKQTAPLIHCTVRVNVDRQNIEDAWRVLPVLSELGESCMVTVYFDFVSNTHCTQTHCLKYVLQDTNEMLGIVELWRHQLELGFPLVGRKISEGACGHFSKYKLTIDVDGYIYPCIGFAGIPSTAIGSVRETSLSERAEQLNTHKPWLGCLDCRYIALCFGGCRVQAFLANHALDSVVCRKQFLARANEEYLRLYYSETNQRLLARRRVANALR